MQIAILLNRLFVRFLTVFILYCVLFSFYSHASLKNSCQMSFIQSFKSFKSLIQDALDSRDLSLFSKDRAIKAIHELADRNELNIDTTNKDKETLLHLASRYGSAEQVEFLLHFGFNVNAQNKNGDTPLHLSLYQPESIQIMQTLLEAGANPNAVNKNGDSILHLVTQYGLTEHTRLLIQAKADVNVIDESEDTPLHFAMMNGTVDQIKLLLDAGANPNMINEYHQTPLYLIIRYGLSSQIQKMKALIEAGANVNAVSENKDTLLHTAIQYRTADWVKALIEAGADTEARGANQNTPLHLAIKTRADESVMKLLLDSGIDLSTKDKNGRTLFDMAKKLLNTDMLKLFLQYTGDQPVSS